MVLINVRKSPSPHSTTLDLVRRFRHVPIQRPLRVAPPAHTQVHSPDCCQDLLRRPLLTIFHDSQAALTLAYFLL